MRTLKKFLGYFILWQLISVAVFGMGVGRVSEPDQLIILTVFSEVFVAFLYIIYRIGRKEYWFEGVLYDTVKLTAADHQLEIEPKKKEEEGEKENQTNGSTHDTTDSPM